MALDEVALAHPVSASQIDTYLDCPKKWGLDKLDHVERPSNKYAERGSDLHGLLENWLEGGVPIDPTTEYGKMLVPGLKYLPVPGSTFVEHRFRLETSTAIYIGLWDVWDPLNRAGRARVLDHKTTSDFKWIKTAEDLRKDVQANIYSMAALVAQNPDEPEDLPEPDAREVELNWVYYRANEKKPGARKIQLHVLPDGAELPPRSKDVRPEHFGVMHHSELHDRFEEIEKVASVLIDHHRHGRKAADLDYNVEACGMYGGCPYRGTACKLTSQQLLRGRMKQADLAEKIARMKKAKAEAAAAAEVAKTTGTNGTPSPAAPAPVLSMAERMAAAVKRGPKPAATEASPEVVAAAAATTQAAAAPKPEAPPAVNPPEVNLGVDPDMPPVSLRDQFALAALPTLVGHPGDYGVPEIARLAYAIADAMLKERG